MASPLVERAALRTLVAAAARIDEAALEVEPLEGADGARALVHGPDFTAWVTTEARARAEAERFEAAASHPLAPRARRVEGAVIFCERARLPLEAKAEALLRALGARVEVRTDTLRAWLTSAPDDPAPLDPARALVHAGLSRRRVDRLLARRVTLARAVGPSLGGLMPAWLRRADADARPIALSSRRARVEGSPLADLASLALRAGLDLRAAHRTRVPEGAQADLAYDVALLGEALREAVFGRDPNARAQALDLAERLDPAAPPHVRLHVDGPPWLDLAAFSPLGDEVPASHARFVLRALDGLSVGGVTVRVTTTPPVRPGRAARVFEPEEVRRRRLFSRWDEGVRIDDEGLFSATPEALADRLVRGLSGRVLDGTTGLGALALALARRPEVREVVACDLDASRLALAAHNARVYGVADRIRFMHADARVLLEAERFDGLVLDPPWGGRDYDRRSVELGALPLDVRPLLALHAGPAVLKLPRSLDVATLPPGFVPEALVDARGVVKLLAARRGLPP